VSAPAILGIATDTPYARYSQNEILEYFLEQQGTDHRRTRAMRAIFERAGVGFRHSVVGRGSLDGDKTTKARNDYYMAEAVPLGERIIRQGLKMYGYKPEDIDDFTVVSCTGFSIPGLDLHLAQRLGMRPDLRRTCVLGMGCYGAFPGLRRAYDAVRDRHDRLAVVLTLELCSLHLQWDDSAESIVSSSLFSDGAAMALVGDETLKKEDRALKEHSVRIIDSATYCDYKTLDHMSFTMTNEGFRMYLSSYVPDLLAAQIEPFIDGLLAKNNLKRADVRLWGIHPGSAKIIDHVQARLGLTDGQVESSHAVLYEYGNMSSATILFVLDHIQRCEKPSVGDYGVLMAFGPGLTMEGLLVQW
jgi:predicted naringenin-chalcone synthase